MEQEPPTTYRIWISVGLAVLGISLVGTSLLVTDDAAHILLTRIIQIIMTISGSVCVFLAVIVFFLRNSPDVNS